MHKPSVFLQSPLHTGTGVQAVYLYSNASDTAEKKAKLALVMWKTATLPAHHMQT